jgi:type IV secretory pathway VirB6-like protein
VTFQHLKWASFTHSTIYLCLLVVWIVPGLHGLEFVFGLAHGLGWIAMCVACVVALRMAIIPLRLAVAVAVIGAIGPFVGSYEFVREERRRAAGRADPVARYSHGSHGS